MLHNRLIVDSANSNYLIIQSGVKPDSGKEKINLGCHQHCPLHQFFSKVFMVPKNMFKGRNECFSVILICPGEAQASTE